jgi:hypothetical protein
MVHRATPLQQWDIPEKGIKPANQPIFSEFSRTVDPTIMQAASAPHNFRVVFNLNDRRS